MAVNMYGIPSHIQQMGMTYRLGAPIKDFKTSVVGPIIWGILAVGLGFVIAMGALSNKHVTFASIIAPLIIAILFVAFGVWMFVSAINLAGQRIYLFQQGIIIENKGQAQPFPWSQTAEVWQSITRNYRNGIYTGTTYSYRLKRIDGYEIKLDNTTKGIAELGDALAQGVTRELLPRAIDAIRAGQTLPFGPLSVQPQGITHKQTFYYWSQLQAVGANRGWITIHVAGQRSSRSVAMVRQVPNYLVFAALTNYMLKQAGRP